MLVEVASSRTYFPDTGFDATANYRVTAPRRCRDLILRHCSSVFRQDGRFTGKRLLIAKQVAATRLCIPFGFAAAFGPNANVVPQCARTRSPSSSPLACKFGLVGNLFTRPLNHDVPSSYRASGRREVCETGHGLCESVPVCVLCNTSGAARRLVLEGALLGRQSQ